MRSLGPPRSCMRIMNMLFTLSHYLVVLQTISELVHLKEAFDMHLPNVFQSTGLKQMVMKGLYSKRSLSNGKQSGRADGTSSGSPSSASSKRGYEKKRGSSSMLFSYFVGRKGYTSFSQSFDRRFSHHPPWW
ncbi:uncharacterized protein LOC111310437 isoform X2 [Durio zibethinus]|uniref:Uncharacterized protein LOC111310437 isoform X2 n=1 Tax=Durio zibethinus TaxID=66656 RepID=A0A6P6ALD3_DURZI|nr:uncharacterized protein LOC111310437 isoform X2 [Durio zibethinus]